jgi:hypothetical protein
MRTRTDRFVVENIKANQMLRPRRLTRRINEFRLEDQQDLLG